MSVNSKKIDLYKLFNWENDLVRHIERYICDEIDQVFYTFSLSITKCQKAGCTLRASQRVNEEMMPYNQAARAEITRTRVYEFCELCDTLTPLDT